MHCERCGAEINAGARYCGSCGAPVPGASSSPHKSWKHRLAGIVGRSRRERTLAGGTLLAIVVVIAAFVVLGTSDDDETPRDSFTLAADRQCLQAKNAVLKGGPGLGEVPLEEYSGRVLSAMTDWRNALNAMQVPPDRIAEVTALDASLGELTAGLRAVSRVAREGAGTELASPVQATNTAVVNLEAAVDALGLADCSAVSLGS